MKRMAFVLAAILAVSPAAADTPPGPWDRARDPSAADTYRAHVHVRDLLKAVREMKDVGRPDIIDPYSARVALEALRILEAHGGEKSRDVRIRFDLGEVYFEQARTKQEYARAREILESALEDAPDHPAAEHAWLTLAFACGHMGDHVCEKKAYVEVLSRVTEEVLRATPTLNLAETEMHLGNLKEAIEGYREALRLAGRTARRDTAPLAVWGLAVALDRSGDPVGAEKEARFALELEESMGRHRILHDYGVFFVPEYEVRYYDGLGAFARGKVAKSGAEAARHFARAETEFAGYIRAADPQDRWLPMAKARLASAKAEREKAERRARSEPVRRVPGPHDEPSDVSL